MKKTLTICLLALALAGCYNTKGDENGNVAEWGIQILKMRSCDYVIYKDNQRSSISMVHAGDCTNPIHRPLFKIDKDGTRVFYDQSSPSANQ